MKPSTALIHTFLCLGYTVAIRHSGQPSKNPTEKSSKKHTKNPSKKPI